MVWHAALACFVLAAMTGFLYRLGMLGADLWGLHLQNIRHAHSHLMFFSWAVPMPMYVIVRRIHRAIPYNAPNLLMARMAMASLLMGLASYPFFLGYGYRPVTVAGLELPLSVIFAGLVMLCWYGFMAGYWKERKYLAVEPEFPFYDGAVLMLFICSLGAWGVAAVQFSGVENPLLGKVLTHFFLATFTEGWIVLVLLGVICQQCKVDKKSLPVRTGLPVSLILFGAPLTFPYGISEGLMSPMLQLVARIGGGMAAAGLLLAIYTLYRSGAPGRRWWLWPVGLLALKGVMQLAVSVIPSNFWLSDHGLRIFYLHVLLLGALTLGLIGWLHGRTRLSNRYYDGVVGSVMGVLASLVMVSRLWPAAWGGPWVFYLLAVMALLPALAVSVHWLKLSNEEIQLD